MEAGAGMAAITSAIGNVGSIITEAMGVITAEPLFMLGIGFGLLITGVGFVKSLI